MDVLAVVDTQHVWARNNGFAEIRNRSNKERGALIHEALRLACDYHLKIPQRKQGLNGVYKVALIHFPEALLTNYASRTELLTATQAHSIDVAAGYATSRLKDPLNNIGEKLESRLQSGVMASGEQILLKYPEFSNKYIQAPVYPGYLVDAFIKEKKGETSSQAK